jgi:hypothetical protein
MRERPISPVWSCTEERIVDVKCRKKLWWRDQHQGKFAGGVTIREPQQYPHCRSSFSCSIQPQPPTPPGTNALLLRPPLSPLKTALQFCQLLSTCVSTSAADFHIALTSLPVVFSSLLASCSSFSPSPTRCFTPSFPEPLRGLFSENRHR